jgi:NAD+ synthase
MKTLLAYLRNKVESHLATSNLESLVLGVSGGVDSAVVAAIVRPLCDNVIGMSLPSATNKPEEVERANLVGRNLCSQYIVHPIDAAYEFMRGELSPDTNIRRGNIKARLRMMMLYDCAAANRGCVLSTDNLTELMLGFWTLHGDVGDLAPIQNLWKTEVYALSRWIVENEPVTAEALQACIDAVPTDGLGVSASDLEQFGASSYDEVDTILKKMEYNNEYDLASPVIARHFRTEFKRENPYNIPIPRNELGEISL